MRIVFCCKMRIRMYEKMSNSKKLIKSISIVLVCLKQCATSQVTIVHCAASYRVYYNRKRK